MRRLAVIGFLGVAIATSVSLGAATTTTAPVQANQQKPPSTALAPQNLIGAKIDFFRNNASGVFAQEAGQTPQLSFLNTLEYAATLNTTQWKGTYQYVSTGPTSATLTILPTGAPYADGVQQTITMTWSAAGQGTYQAMTTKGVGAYSGSFQFK